jgi:large subunit ribosomal protein L10
MAKEVKALQMRAMKETFSSVRDLVVLSMQGLGCTVENQMRLDLRKKNVRLQVVKNSLCRRVFDELNIQVEGCWDGPTTLAYGGSSIAELSRTLDAALAELAKKHPKLKDKVKIKTAVAEGRGISFERAKTMPTREEAIATILGMILGPAQQVVGQLIGPAAQIAGQLQTLSERKPDETASPAPA